ncbi:MAG: LysM peptidoglycan-binding domain-containing protein [candidate division KSB1 bacterium]|nr:LysM peptidoglycan-binding domain-containing protein [candidate division KSB1 bacterium]
MKMFAKFTLAIACGAFAFSLATASFAQEEKMTMEEYQAQLQEWQKREDDAKAEIARLDQEIANLKQQIQDTEQQTASVWNEIYALLGTDAAGVEAYRNQLNALNNQVDGLMALSPEELFKRRKELDDLEAQLNELKQSKIYALTEMQNLVASIEGKITQLRSRMPKAIYDEYTVMRGDYLWKIAGKSDIYGDPYQWVRIYSYNRDQIKDPDLIYPDQIFKIQREVGPDEYLVEKGDFLYKIAGKTDVLGDPTLWTKLYEANKDIVGSDPSLIYPFQVLRIPR